MFLKPIALFLSLTALYFAACQESENFFHIRQEEGCNYQYPGYVPPPGDDRVYHLPVANGTIPSWGACAGSTSCDKGKVQSPIMINSSQAVLAPDLGSIQFSWRSVDNASLTWSGTNQVYTVPPKNQSHPSWVWQSAIQEKFYLGQFHLHLPAEHIIDGYQADVEVHFVHRNEVGNMTAVIGIRFEVGTEEDWSDFFEIMLNENPEASAKELHNLFPALSLAELPGQSYYHYIGSFTVPPCTEGLFWFVMADTVKINPSQLERLKEFQEPNNRPTQPLKGRTINLFKEEPKSFCSKVGSDCETCTNQCASSCKSTCKGLEKSCKSKCNDQCVAKLCGEVC